MFRAGDAGALAARALELLEQCDRWPALRAAGRRFVEQERNWPASVGRYVGVYGWLARFQP